MVFKMWTSTSRENKKFWKCYIVTQQRQHYEFRCEFKSQVLFSTFLLIDLLQREWRGSYPDVDVV